MEEAVALAVQAAAQTLAATFERALAANGLPGRATIELSGCAARIVARSEAAHRAEFGGPGTPPKAFVAIAVGAAAQTVCGELARRLEAHLR